MRIQMRMRKRNPPRNGGLPLPSSSVRTVLMLSRPNRDFETTERYPKIDKSRLAKAADEDF